MSLLKKGAVECLGIALLILISSGFFGFIRDNFPNYEMVAPICAAVLMFVLFLVFYPTTGAHFNPITTVGVYLANLLKPKDQREFGVKELGTYIIAQLIGAMLGSAVNTLIFGTEYVGIANPVEEFEVLSNFDFRAIIIEILLAAIFVFIYLTISRIKYRHLISKALIIAFLTLVILIIGNFTTRTTVNPFRALIPSIFDYFFTDLDVRAFDELWIYTIGPFIGALIGVGIYWAFSFIPRKDRNSKLCIYTANINLNMYSFETTGAQSTSYPSYQTPMLQGNDRKVDDTSLVDKETTLARANQTFEERIGNLDKDLLRKYQNLRDYCLKYGLKEKMSGSYNVFSLNKTRYIVFAIRGKALKIYFALDPKDYENTTIVFQDGTDIAKYKDVPLIFKVKSDLSYKRALSLIEDTMDRAHIERAN